MKSEQQLIEKTPRPPYQSPVLRIYGSIESLTSANVGSTNMDFVGNPGHDKTH
jgi:hypothetical protein